VIWRERFGRSPAISSLSSAADPTQCEAVLLIGDKVVKNRPTGFEVEIDLGTEWKTLTGLPFVFAVWAAKEDSGRLRKSWNSSKESSNS